PPDVVATMLSPQMPVPVAQGGAPVRYAFGLNVTTWGRYRLIEHSGGRGGYGSLFRLLPDQQMAIIIFGNRTSAALQQTLDAVTEIVTGVPRPSTTAASDGQPGQAAPAVLAGRWING